MTTWQEPRSGATDATELCGESEALVAAIGASLASYACLIGVVTPVIYWSLGWGYQIVISSHIMSKLSIQTSTCCEWVCPKIDNICVYMYYDVLASLYASMYI